LLAQLLRNLQAKGAREDDEETNAVLNSLYFDTKCGGLATDAIVLHGSSPMID